jgi:hypothetical protein
MHETHFIYVRRGAGRGPMRSQINCELSVKATRSALKRGNQRCSAHDDVLANLGKWIESLQAPHPATTPRWAITGLALTCDILCRRTIRCRFAIQGPFVSGAGVTKDQRSRGSFAVAKRVPSRAPGNGVNDCLVKSAQRAGMETVAAECLKRQRTTCRPTVLRRGFPIRATAGTLSSLSDTCPDGYE